MFLKFFYIYPLPRIQQLFPKLKDPLRESCTSDICGILKGWGPPMADATDKIYKIDTEQVDDDTGRKFYTLWANDFYFDERLGDVLLVDTQKKDDCYFLNQY